MAQSPKTGPRLEFHSNIQWAQAYQRNNKANGQKNLRCFPNHCQGLGHQRGFCGHSIVVNFYYVPQNFKGALYSFAHFCIADCELNSPAAAAARGVSRERFQSGDILTVEQVRCKIRQADDPLLEYIEGLELQDRRLDGDGMVRVNFEFNRNLKGWHYGFLGSKLTRNVYHTFRAYVLELLPGANGESDRYRVLASVTSPKWKLFCRRRNRSGVLPPKIENGEPAAKLPNAQQTRLPMNSEPAIATMPANCAIAANAHSHVNVTKAQDRKLKKRRPESKLYGIPGQAILTPGRRQSSGDSDDCIHPLGGFQNFGSLPPPPPPQARGNPSLFEDGWMSSYGDNIKVHMRRQASQERLSKSGRSGLSKKRQANASPKAMREETSPWAKCFADENFSRSNSIPDLLPYTLIGQENGKKMTDPRQLSIHQILKMVQIDFKNFTSPESPLQLRENSQMQVFHSAVNDLLHIWAAPTRRARKGAGPGYRRARSSSRTRRDVPPCEEYELNEVGFSRFLVDTEEFGNQLTEYVTKYPLDQRKTSPYGNAAFLLGKLKEYQNNFLGLTNQKGKKPFGLAMEKEDKADEFVGSLFPCMSTLSLRGGLDDILGGSSSSSSRHNAHTTSLASTYELDRFTRELDTLDNGDAAFSSLAALKSWRKMSSQKLTQKLSQIFPPNLLTSKLSDQSFLNGASFMKKSKRGSFASIPNLPSSINLRKASISNGNKRLDTMKELDDFLKTECGVQEVEEVEVK